MKQGDTKLKLKVFVPKKELKISVVPTTKVSKIIESIISHNGMDQANADDFGLYQVKSRKLSLDSFSSCTNSLDTEHGFDAERAKDELRKLNPGETIKSQLSFPEEQQYYEAKDFSGFLFFGPSDFKRNKTLYLKNNAESDLSYGSKSIIQGYLKFSQLNSPLEVHKFFFSLAKTELLAFHDATLFGKENPSFRLNLGKYRFRYHYDEIYLHSLDNQKSSYILKGSSRSIVVAWINNLKHYSRIHKDQLLIEKLEKSIVSTSEKIMEETSRVYTNCFSCFSGLFTTNSSVIIVIIYMYTSRISKIVEKRKEIVLSFIVMSELTKLLFYFRNLYLQEDETLLLLKHAQREIFALRSVILDISNMFGETLQLPFERMKKQKYSFSSLVLESTSLFFTLSNGVLNLSEDLKVTQLINSVTSGSHGNMVAPEPYETYKMLKVLVEMKRSLAKFLISEVGIMNVLSQDMNLRKLKKLFYVLYSHFR
eukprot:snap_masked-scaffold_9-processed-gene-0.18-mRNA-1 protein AED:1.00 eAED:1.00 QI:0/-1/0/0/-1/1/1/0/480